MIVELNGLPGSGKTVIKKKVLKAMRDKNVIAAGVDEFRGTGKSKINKFFLKVYRILSQFFPENIGLYLMCRRLLLLNCQEKHEFAYKSKYECKIVIAYLIYLYQIYKNNKQTVIVDEGFVQTLTAITVHIKNSNQLIVEILNKLCADSGNIIAVNINVSVEDTYQNIINRNRHDSDMDSLKGEKLLRFLQRYSHKLAAIRGIFKANEVIDLDYEKSSIEKNVKKIIEGVTKYE